MNERAWARRLMGLHGALATAAVVAGVVATAASWVGCSSAHEPAPPSASTQPGEEATPAATPSQPGESVPTAAGDPGAAGPEAPEEVRLAPDESLPPLPDGTFTGRFQGEGAAVSVRLVVRDGMVLAAHVEVVGKRRTSLELQPVVASDARTLSFQGRFGADYLRLKGRFVDARRAAGTFEGQVDRKRISGRWYALRR